MPAQAGIRRGHMRKEQKVVHKQCETKVGICAEELCCLRFASMDIDKAARYVGIVKAQADNRTMFPILEAAIVSYAKPFLNCKIKPSKERALLKTKDVPLQYKNLHKGLIDYRNKFVAHADIDVRNPKLSKWNKAGEMPCFPMSFKGYQIEDWSKKIHEIEILLLLLQKNVLEQIKKCEKELDLSVENERNAA